MPSYKVAINYISSNLIIKIYIEVAGRIFMALFESAKQFRKHNIFMPQGLQALRLGKYILVCKFMEE